VVPSAPSFEPKRVTDLSEVRQPKVVDTFDTGKKTPPTNRAARRSDFGVVKRQGPRRYLEIRFSSSIARSHEARVLVVDGVGKQLSVRRIVIMGTGAFERTRSICVT
jgi:hypothetical protein